MDTRARGVRSRLASPSFGAIVLAGGKSERLGFDKALLRINSAPLVQWLPQQLGALFAPVAVVADRPERYPGPVPQLVDALSGAGPLAGIAAGLEALAVPALFVCACDMPLLRPALLRRLNAALDGYELAIPERAGRLEPLCAVYAASCLPTVRRLLRQGRFRANGVAAEVRARILSESEWKDVDPLGDSFLSINTMADLDLMVERAGAYGLTLTR